ncbi:hypothetical protein FRB91_010006 [Serendipita sp. 411]|nr:hypothetical protein FRC15_005138 [Serendipita sp. 397]KAG8808082.1 hypothetical protein FRC18_005198 [Serendipita sp. 400]KAG8844660.1 hypothetical protein FRC20_003428 [Serendipita sp. 405]KAG8849384.1 hypothetical protein FRB91_010006 [Serendipita sp. 411]
MSKEKERWGAQDLDNREEEEEPKETAVRRVRIDQGALNFTPSQVGTSQYAGSMAEISHQDEDARSKISIYSYHTDTDAVKFLQEIDRRIINNLSDQ